MPRLNGTDPELASVYERFLNAFEYLETSIRPVERHQVEEISYLHWPSKGRRGGRFHYEFFGLEPDPVEMIAAVNQVNPQQPFFISDFYGPRGPVGDGYAALGFVSTFQEPLMTLDLTTIGKSSSEIEVFDVVDIAMADRIFAEFDAADALPRAISQRQIDDPNTLVKVILIDGMPACTGKGVLLGDALYVTDIGTLPAYRKRGLAGAVMTALHHSARERGATTAILSATEMAARIYASKGYQQIGTLDIYERGQT